MNVRRALRSRPFTAGAIAAAILIGLVIAAALAPPTLVNIAGEGTLVVGIERPTRPAITGGRASSIVDGWYAAPLHRPIISHWNAPVGPTGNWAELRFEPPRPITGTTLFWGVGEVAPRSFDVRADFGEGYEAVAGYRGLGAEAVPIALPARPVHGLRVDIHEGYSETDTAHWAEWLVFEQQPALGVLLLKGVAPLVQRLLVALAFLALILLPGFTIARRLPGRLTRNASFVVGIPIALGLLGGLSALVLWRGWPAWPTLIILGAIAAYGVGHPSTRRDLARVDRRMLAIAAAGALLHVLVWHLFDTIAPKHGGDTLYPLEVARVFMTQTPFDTPDLRHTLFGYPVGFRTPLLSLLVAPFLGAFGNDVTTYLTLIYAASGLFYIPAYGVMRQHVGRAAAELGGVFLVFNAALLQWTEQVPNKLLSQSLILVALYIAAFGPNRRPFARHVSVGAVLALAYLTHNSALLGFAAVAAFEILRARAFRRGLARVIATAIPIMAVALVWAVWQGATGDAPDAFGRELAGASADVVAGGNPLSMALQRLRSIPLAEHISERLYGLASIFVWDPQGNLPEQTSLSGTLQTLIPRVGVVVFVLALLNYRRVPSRARLALLTLTIVPALLTVLAFSRAGPVSPFIAFAFAYVAAFAGVAAWRTGQVRYLGSNLSGHHLVIAVVAIEFLLQILALYGDAQIANGAYGWPSSVVPILAAAGVLALGLRSIAAWAECRAVSQT